MNDHRRLSLISILESARMFDTIICKSEKFLSARFPPGPHYKHDLARFSLLSRLYLYLILSVNLATILILSASSISLVTSKKIYNFKNFT